MSLLNTKNWCAVSRFLSVVAAVAVVLLLAASAHGPAPGITGTAFSLNAGKGWSSQPDGVLVYSWGYGCTGGTPGSATFAPANVALPFCPTVKFPGPTLIVTENTAFTVTLTNSLPTAAGHVSLNTSILFPGAKVTTSCPAAQQGLLTCEAAPGCTVTYNVIYSAPGTHEYYSGTQPDLQIEMGLFGAVVVRPSTSYSNSTSTPNCTAMDFYPAGRTEFRLATSAYDNPKSCYDREYLTHWSEMEPKNHRQVEDQLKLIATCPTTATAQFSCPTSLNVVTEPYHPN